MAAMARGLVRPFYKRRQGNPRCPRVPQVSACAAGAEHNGSFAFFTRSLHAPPPTRATRCRQHRRAFPRCLRASRESFRAGLSGQADQADHRLPRRRADRHHDALARRQRVQGPRPAGDRGEQARRRRHLAGAAASNGATGWLHRGADSARRVPPALHHQDHVGPGQGHRVRAERHRLRLRHGGAGRFAAEVVDALRRMGQGQPGAAHLRIHRHADQPAPHHGADRAEAGHPAAARPVQGQRRTGSGHRRRPHHGGFGFDRLRAAGGGGQAARPEHLGREAAGEVPRRAHAQGAGHRHRAELALRHRRAARHAAGA